MARSDSAPPDQLPTEIASLEDLETGPENYWVEFSSGDFETGEAETDRSGRSLPALPPPSRPLRIVVGRLSTAPDARAARREPTRMERPPKAERPRSRRRWIVSLLILAALAAAPLDVVTEVVEQVREWVVVIF